MNGLNKGENDDSGAVRMYGQYLPFADGGGSVSGHGE
jgi:hypothetical protein